MCICTYTWKWKWKYAAECVFPSLDGWMDGWMHGWMHGWMDVGMTVPGVQVAAPPQKRISQRASREVKEKSWLLEWLGDKRLFLGACSPNAESSDSDPVRKVGISS